MVIAGEIWVLPVMQTDARRVSIWTELGLNPYSTALREAMHKIVSTDSGQDLH
jgi:hypothetical protein